LSKLFSLARTSVVSISEASIIFIFIETKGRSANLMKDTSKRKKKKSEMEDVKMEENEMKENK